MVPHIHQSNIQTCIGSCPAGMEREIHGRHAPCIYTRADQTEIVVSIRTCGEIRIRADIAGPAGPTALDIAEIDIR